MSPWKSGEQPNDVAHRFRRLVFERRSVFLEEIGEGERLFPVVVIVVVFFRDDREPAIAERPVVVVDRIGRGGTLPPGRRFGAERLCRLWHCLPILCRPVCAGPLLLEPFEQAFETTGRVVGGALFGRKLGDQVLDLCLAHALLLLFVKFVPAALDLAPGNLGVRRPERPPKVALAAVQILDFRLDPEIQMVNPTANLCPFDLGKIHAPHHWFFDVSRACNTDRCARKGRPQGVE